jgi:hypothetical protein
LSQASNPAGPAPAGQLVRDKSGHADNIVTEWRAIAVSDHRSPHVEPGAGRFGVLRLGQLVRPYGVDIFDFEKAKARFLAIISRFVEVAR